MNFLLTNEQRKNLAILSFVAIFLGFFLSRALMSIGMLVIFGLAIINTDIVANVKRYLASPLFLAWPAIIILYLFGGLYSENPDKFLHIITNKLPLLGLSFGLLSLPLFSRKTYHLIYYIIFAIVFTAGLYTLIDFFIHFEAQTPNLNFSRYINTPTNHIRYSLIIANLIFIALYLSSHPKTQKPKLERVLLITLALFFVFLLHFIAARSGILAFYVCVFIFGLKQVFQGKQKWLGIAFVASVLFLPVAAYYMVGSFKDKINYTIYDFKHYLSGGNVELYSDSQRLVAYELALKAIKEKPVLGYGTSDVHQKINALYASEFPQFPNIERLYGTNQFLYIGLSFGLFGLVVFIIWLLKIYPPKFVFNNNLLLPAALINLVSFIPENTLETQFGVAVFCTFSLMALHYSTLPPISND